MDSATFPNLKQLIEQVRSHHRANEVASLCDSLRCYNLRSAQQTSPDFLPSSTQLRAATPLGSKPQYTCDHQPINAGQTRIPLGKCGAGAPSARLILEGRTLLRQAQHTFLGYGGTRNAECVIGRRPLAGGERTRFLLRGFFIWVEFQVDALIGVEIQRQICCRGAGGS